MNSYELSSSWFNWCFENPEKISTNHTAMYFFIIEHCNRLGWKEKFGLPMEMTKDAIGIKNYRTYSNTLNDLIEWGFITLIQKSKNQYSSSIIAIAKNTKASTKALDNAMQKHNQKQSQDIVCIDKHINNITIEQETIILPKNEFSEDVIKIYDASIKLFSDDLKPANEKQKNIWLNEFDKLIRLDNLTIGQIYSIIKFGRSDDFWKDNFLSVLKLRKKNKEDLQYWKVFKHKSELNINNNTDPYKTAV